MVGGRLEMIGKRQGVPRLPRASGPLMCGEVLVDALLTLKPARQELKVSRTAEPCKLQSHTVPSIVGGHKWDA